MKLSLISNYKQLSPGKKSWKKTYVSERAWDEMGIDVDSVVFFHIRKYLESPDLTREKQTMIAASFLSDFEKSVGLLVKAIALYSTEQFRRIIGFLESKKIKFYPVASNSIPPLKTNLVKEREMKSLEIRRNIEQLGRNILVPGVRTEALKLIKKYTLNLRDEVRDRVVRDFPTSLKQCKEADKWCGRKYDVTISEDVDLFLFGSDETTIIKPFLIGKKGPLYFDNKNWKCFESRGINSHKDFIEVAFLMGTDYNYGIKGMGVVRSTNAISKYGCVTNFINKKYELHDPNSIKTLDNYRKFMMYISDDTI